MPDHTVTPEPTEDEAAAIAAALHTVLAASGAPAGDDAPAADPVWRFSGRWWNRPVAQARLRPWRP